MLLHQFVLIASDRPLTRPIVGLRARWAQACGVSHGRRPRGSSNARSGDDEDPIDPRRGVDEVIGRVHAPSLVSFAAVCSCARQPIPFFE
jgi:hypothetical protein